MTADHIHKEKIRISFQQRWPLPVLEKMTLQQYNAIKQTSGGDTYCHWIEHHTDKLGRIKGYDSYKFGIYNRAAHTTYKPEGNTLADGDYNFKSRYGSTKDDAFQNIKNW